MFERYTESARRALFFARYEVSALGAIEIGSEHLLLGLLREAKGLAGSILDEARVSREAIRRAIEESATFLETLPASTEVPMAPAAQAVLQAAAEEADRLLHGYIGTEHLLLGILRVDDSPAAALLTRHGLRLDDARQTLARLSSTPAHHPASRVGNLTLERTMDLYTQLLTAWNNRDAQSFAALFAETGSAVGFDGSQMNGRVEIATSLRAIFSTHQTASYIAKVREIRPLGSHAVLLRAVAGMMPPGSRELNPAVNAVQSVVVVDDPGGATIALLQNTPAAFHGRPELAQRLTEELSAVARAGRIVAPP